MIENEPLFKEALPVLKRLIEAGYEAYFVGGSVRDALLGKPISDVDIATSATPQEVKELFEKTIDVGIEHGTVMVLFHKKGYEVTTFRTEEGYQDFRHPDRVTFVRSLEEDLKRRDFTINALALGMDDVIHDFFDGKGDLQRGMIRCVGNPIERFNEDALRMFRAIRFLGQLGFELDKDTKRAIFELRQHLSHVAVERMRVEFEKMMTSPHRYKAIHMFVETRLYESCPSFSSLSGALLQVAQEPQKRLTISQSWILIAQAAQLTQEELKYLLKEWKNSNELIKNVTIGYDRLQRRQQQEWDFHMAYGCDEALAIQVEELLSEPQLAQVKKVYHDLPIRRLKDIHINGHDIVQLLQLKKQGPIIGTILKDVEKQLLDGVFPNHKPQIKAYILQHYS